MNPDTKEFEALMLYEMRNDLFTRYGHNERDKMPIFTMREELIIKGAVWQIVLIQKDFIKFRFLAHFF